MPDSSDAGCCMKVRIAKRDCGTFLVVPSDGVPAVSDLRLQFATYDGLSDTETCVSFHFSAKILQALLSQLH